MILNALPVFGWRGNNRGGGFINKKTKTPIGIIVYDKDGNDSMRIIYEDFKILKEVEKELFN